MIQFILIKQLPEETNLWLRNLTDELEETEETILPLYNRLKAE